MERSKIKFITPNNTPVANKNIAFLSYRHSDAKYLNEVIKLFIDNANIALWYDENLSIGENYDEEIQEAMISSDMIIQVVMQRYFDIGSYTIKTELPLAKKLGLKTIAIICEAVSPEIQKYVQRNADFVYDISNSEDIHTFIEVINNLHESESEYEHFERLNKRVDTWYLTPDEMYLLAKGYCDSMNSRKRSSLNMTKEKALRYAKMSLIAGIPGAQKIIDELR